MAQRSLKGDVKVEFTEATSRQGIDSGESVKTLFGKIRKWLSDLKPVAFSGSYNDLTNKPTIPPAVAVKGNAETAYRTGNVNLTAANIGLGNVNNTSDLNKPVSTATQAALDSQQGQIDYNTNNGVKNLISTEWFIEDNYSTIESCNDKTGSLTGSAPASASAPYIQTYIPEAIVNSILENGKTYILSWNVDSRTNDGIFGIRKATGVYTSSASATLNRTGSYSVSYTYDSSVPVFISLCINTSATSAVKRIALSNIMLREATVEDSTFQPYAKSNAELTRYTDDIQEQLECIDINAAYVPATGEVHITNTSDFTQQLFSKLYVHDEVRFAVLNLSVSSSTYYLKAIINIAAITQATALEATFINDDTLYRFYWTSNGTPTLTRRTLSFV